MRRQRRTDKSRSFSLREPVSVVRTTPALPWVLLGSLLFEPYLRRQRRTDKSRSFSLREPASVVRTTLALPWVLLGSLMFEPYLRRQRRTDKSRSFFYENLWARKNKTNLERELVLKSKFVFFVGLKKLLNQFLFKVKIFQFCKFFFSSCCFFIIKKSKSSFAEKLTPF